MQFALLYRCCHAVRTAACGCSLAAAVFAFGRVLAADTNSGNTPPPLDRTTLAVEALSRLQGIDLDQNPRIKQAVLKVLEKTRGTANFVKLVDHFNLQDQDAELLDIAVQNPAHETGVAAMRLLLTNGRFPAIEAALRGTNQTVAIHVAEALGNSAKKESTPLLLPLIAERGTDFTLRKQALHSLAQTSDGAAALLRLAREEKLPDDLKLTASSELNRVRWPDITKEAAIILPLPPGRDAQPMPTVAELLRMKGAAANGARVFASPAVGCTTCHQVNGQGVDFGPNLSEIGTKLGKDALYEAILNPSAGISLGYEAWQFQFSSGDEAYGLLVSETPEEVAIKAVGGIVTRYKKKELVSRQQMKLSIMPAGLQQTMTAQELVDLVEYLSSLKKAP